MQTDQKQTVLARLLALLLAGAMVAICWLAKSVTNLEADNRYLRQQLSDLQQRIVAYVSHEEQSVPVTRSSIIEPVIMVYIPKSGSCYHDSAKCAGDNPTLIPLDDAKKKGYDRCQRCLPPK